MTSGQAFFAGPGFGMFGSFLSMLLPVVVLVIVCAWFANALRGGGVDQPNRIHQWYGYTVCIICVVVAFTCVISIIGAAFDRAHPLQNEYAFGPSLSSFESYEASARGQSAFPGPPTERMSDTVSETTLRRYYAAMVADRKIATSYRTSKTFLQSGISCVIAMLLFLGHWRWLGRFRA